MPFRESGGCARVGGCPLSRVPWTFICLAEDIGALRAWGLPLPCSRIEYRDHIHCALHTGAYTKHKIQYTYVHIYHIILTALLQVLCHHFYHTHIHMHMYPYIPYVYVHSGHIIYIPYPVYTYTYTYTQYIHNIQKSRYNTPHTTYTIPPPIVRKSAATAPLAGGREDPCAGGAGRWTSGPLIHWEEAFGKLSAHCARGVYPLRPPSPSYS